MPAVRRTRGAAPAGQPVPPKPFAVGDGRPRGRGCKKGAANAGRPPEWFKTAMQELGSRADVLAVAEEVILDKSHPHYARVLLAVWDRGYDKAAQPIDVDLSTLTDAQLAALAAGQA